MLAWAKFHRFYRLLRAMREGERDRLTKHLSMGLTLSLYLNPHEVNSYAFRAMPVCSWRYDNHSLILCKYVVIKLVSRNGVRQLLLICKCCEKHLSKIFYIDWCKRIIKPKRNYLSSFQYETVCMISPFHSNFFISIAPMLSIHTELE